MTRQMVHSDRLPGGRFKTLLARQPQVNATSSSGMGLQLLWLHHASY